MRRPQLIEPAKRRKYFPASNDKGHALNSEYRRPQNKIRNERAPCKSNFRFCIDLAAILNGNSILHDKNVIQKNMRRACKIQKREQHFVSCSFSLNGDNNRVLKDASGRGQVQALIDACPT
jgi:hypothetical protein